MAETPRITFADPEVQRISFTGNQLTLILAAFIAGCKCANAASTYDSVDGISRDAISQVKSLIDLLEL